MNRTTFIIIALIALIIGALYMAGRAEKKEKEDRDTAPLKDKYVYVDSLKCLHIDKNCFNLGFSNYAVKVYEKSDPAIKDVYEYVCIDCWNPLDPIIKAEKARKSKTPLFDSL